MKNIYLVSVFMLVSICVFSQTLKINYQQEQSLVSNNSHYVPDSIPIIISPGTENATTIKNLETILKSSNGVLFNSYCSTHNIFLITVDKTIYSTKQIFYSNLKSSSNISTLLLKEGNKNDILPFCGGIIPETIEEIEAKKALLDQ